jgi:hypothetical protein
MDTTNSPKSILQIVGERMQQDLTDTFRDDPDGAYLDRRKIAGQLSTPSAPMSQIYVKAFQDAISHLMSAQDPVMSAADTYGGTTGHQMSARFGLAQIVQDQLEPYINQFSQATEFRGAFHFYAVSEWPPLPEKLTLSTGGGAALRQTAIRTAGDVDFSHLTRSSMPHNLMPRVV